MSWKKSLFCRDCMWSALDPCSHLNKSCSLYSSTTRLVKFRLIGMCSLAAMILRTISAVGDVFCFGFLLIAVSSAPTVAETRLTVRQHEVHCCIVTERYSSHDWSKFYTCQLYYSLSADRKNVAFCLRAVRYDNTCAKCQNDTLTAVTHVTQSFVITHHVVLLSVQRAYARQCHRDLERYITNYVISVLVYLRGYYVVIYR